MSRPRFAVVAVIGTGVIGRSWAAVFSRAGCATRLFDADPTTAERALDWLREDLRRDVADGFTTAEEARRQLERLRGCSSLNEALDGAKYVQESGPERLETKQAIYRELDRHAAADAVLASSTSAMDMNEIAGGLTCRRRSIVAHPVNPPHVVPVVEVLPSDETRAELTDDVMAFLSEIGQVPVLLNFFLPGFLLNRMQAALIREAVHLFESGVADADAIDSVIRDGLGLRWALMGPFGVANTNHDEGVRGYFSEFGGAYERMWEELGDVSQFSAQAVEQMGKATDRMSGQADLAEIRRWRDRLVRRIRRAKQEDPHP